jgi:hypothetical protein
MAVDVSVYNEIARNNDTLTQCVSNAYTPCYILGYANGVSAATTINNTGLNCQQGLYSIRLACDLIAQPWCCCYWAAIPTLPSVTGGLFVCDTSYARCGVCCLWTVPGGAQFVRFQMWGAGALSHGSVCCCGISIPGSSGAYASVIIPAVPGCQYTLCAGCAMCCFPDYNNSSTTGSGCASYVNGYGLNGVCAEGGEVSPFCWMKRKMAVNGVDDANFAGICVILPNSTWAYNAIPKGSYTGYCMCTNGGFCFVGNCQTMGSHPFVTSCRTFRGSVTNGTQCCHFVIGTPGSWSKLDGVNNGYYYFPYTPPATCYDCQCYPQCYISGYLYASYYCGMQSVYSNPCSRADNAPGRGGGGSMSSAGNGSYTGFPGNGGAVCVQYL